MGALVAGCSAPGGAPPEAGAATPLASAPTCGRDPVRLRAHFETGFPLPGALAEEFTRQHPNVTWDIREDQFAVLTQNTPRLLADDPPDLLRLPVVAPLVGDGLLKNLDGYASWFGWDDWPAAQLRQLRTGPSGYPRGVGSLYAMGLNTSVTGVFYNKDLAARIGLVAPPRTLPQLDEALARAKAAGITPIAQFNGGATGGLVFPLQALMGAHGPPEAINDWIFREPGATIDTPSNLRAARHLRRWIADGYFPADVNAVDYAQMTGRFTAGQALFMFNGDWESGALDARMPGRVGFFTMPPEREGGPSVAMSTPITFGVAARARHPDCVAVFLDWAATDPAARAIGVRVGGSRPMGPPEAPLPSPEPGTVTAATLAAGARVAEDGGAMDFIANATGAIYAKGWTPQLQKLAAGEQSPEGLLKAVQDDYERQIGG